MNLTIIGHDDRYSVEQLMLSLFSQDTDGNAVSRLTRGKTWLTAVAEVEIGGKKTRSVRRLKAKDESVRLRRRILQQSFYLAALPHLENAPAWGALAGVRPTKISTKHLLEGGTEKSADRLLQDVYYVTPQRRELAIACSASTVKAVEKMDENDISLYVGIPFCPTRCAYCSFVSSTIGRDGSLLDDYLKALHRELAVLGDIVFQIGIVNALEQLFEGGCLEVSQHQQHALAGTQADIGLCHGDFVAGEENTAVLYPDVLDIQPAQFITGNALQTKEAGHGKFKIRHRFLLKYGSSMIGEDFSSRFF